jgi:hypothetical protein
MSKLTPLPIPNFHDEGHIRVRSLRLAVANVLRSVGAALNEPQEIGRNFGLDKTLAWKLSRLVLEEDALSSVVHAPRLPGLLLFERAMAKAGASSESMADLRSAIQGFEQFVEQHAGDRDVMEIMVTTPPARASANAKKLEQFRKDGFIANSAIWGVSANVHLAMRWVAPSAQAGMVDLVTVCGFLSFRRLRSDIPWTAASLFNWHTTGPQVAEPLTSLGGTRQMPLLAHFCSKPLPPMRTVRDGDVRTRLMIDAGPVGMSASADVLLGWVHRASAPIRATQPGEQGEHGAMLSTPAELLLHDIFIHRDLAFAHNPSATVYGLLPGGPQYPAADVPAQILPVPTDLQQIDAGQLTPEVPQYADIAAKVAQSVGHDPWSFRGFRFRVKYPPIPAISVIKHALME